MKRSNYLWMIMLGIGLLTGCFRPIIYLQNQPNYPIDVFYDSQRPERPYEPLQDMETKGETALTDRQTINRRMLARGNNMQQKEVLLARLTMEAKKLGADALVGVRYKYYTSRHEDGYLMTGLAVKYRKEQ
ncbi:hypothetical protein [Spirosoma utsteinense]|uniref:YbjQ family protein n=1 Tax=Spirosoma utsteinense TaxID=2585773 RepID=A0ABR6W4U5_9BACT|nr:hypothetical protein [Spirosoma utsteinense]MBC3785356.1 hypothetical protein [Spirosoma utsteinense]MBC3791617.1 hypothetical protein [Spirosoma utsteinense]